MLITKDMGIKECVQNILKQPLYLWNSAWAA